MHALAMARTGLLLALTIPLLLAGCSTFAASRYSVSSDTVTALRAYRGQPIAIGAFTATESGRTEIACRAVGPISTPDHEPFEEFVRKAFITELTLAEAYAVAAPITLTGTLDHIDFSSGVYFTEASWDIGVTLRSSNGAHLAAREKYIFKASYGAESGCLNTAQALMPAVQNLVKQIVQHPEFARLVLVK